MTSSDLSSTPTLLSGPHAGLLLVALVALVGCAVLVAILAPVDEPDEPEAVDRVWTADNAVPRRQARR